MIFAEVLGQERAVRRLRNLLESGRTPAALLFHGPEGVGKKKAALALAKALGCERRSATLGACDGCARCEAVDKGVSGDVRVVDAVYQAHLLEKEPEKALEKQREWKVNTIREICAEMQKRSFTGGFKVALLDDAHRMNVEAQNALLKMLEEPPDRTLWILVSDAPARLLPTVRSRIQAVAFAPLPPSDLIAILERLGLPEADVSRLATAGSVVSAFRQLEAEKEFGGLEGPLAPFEAAESLPRELAPARTRVELALDFFAARAREVWNAEPDRAYERLREVRRLRGLLRSNVSPSLVIETAFLKLGHDA